ncbi:gsk3, partial [Symbiodinium sp. KB8]
GEPLCVEDVRCFSFQLLRALAHLDGTRIVHRDLKPENILLDPGSRAVRVADFGSAKVEVGGREYYCECYDGTGVWSRAVGRRRKPTHTFVYKTRLRRGEFAKIWELGVGPFPSWAFTLPKALVEAAVAWKQRHRQGLDRPRSKCTSTPPRPLDPSHVREGGLRSVDGAELQRSEVRNLNNLPSNWVWECFTVVDAGNGQVAFHNAAHNGFIQMRGTAPGSTDPRGTSDFQSTWTWERFTVVPADHGQFVFHSTHHNRMMTSHNMDSSGHMAIQDLPSACTWERFRIVPLYD